MYILIMCVFLFHRVSERDHSPLNISEPLLNILESVAVPPASNQRPRPDTKQPATLFSHHLQVPTSEQLLPKNKGSEPQRSAQPKQPDAMLRVQTSSPETTQGPRRLCTSPCPAEHQERDICLTPAPEDDLRSDSEGTLSHTPRLLGRSSPKQNTDLAVTSASRTRSPSPQFYPQRLTDEPPAVVQKKDPCRYLDY